MNMGRIASMPIKAENRHRYPRDWKQIRAEILGRAGQRCEQCGVPNRAWRLPGFGAWTFDPATADEWSDEGRKATRIVLTIAHLDHTPENCDPANLRALCCQCHNRYDVEHRKKTRAATLRRKKAAAQLHLFSYDPQAHVQ